MTDEITVNFGADVRALKRGTDEIVDGLDDTEKALEKVGDAGEDASEKVTDGLEEVGDKGKDVAGTVKDELGEAFKNWDGTAQGAVESVGGALSGLAALIPGIGGLVGAGLGVVVTEWAASWDEGAKENAAAVSSMYEDMIASGNKFASQSFIADALKDLYDDDGKMAEVLEAADKLGISVATVAEAWVGVPDALDVVLDKTRQLSDEARNNDVGGEAGLIAYYAGVSAELTGVQGNTAIAADKAMYYEATVAQNAGRWTEVGGEVDTVGQKIANLPQPKPVVLVPDTSQLDAVLRQQRYANVEVQFTRNGVPVY